MSSWLMQGVAKHLNTWNHLPHTPELPVAHFLPPCYLPVLPANNSPNMGLQVNPERGVLFTLQSILAKHDFCRCLKTKSIILEK